MNARAVPVEVGHRDRWSVSARAIRQPGSLWDGHCKYKLAHVDEL